MREVEATTPCCNKASESCFRVGPAVATTLSSIRMPPKGLELIDHRPVEGGFDAAIGVRRGQ